MEGLAVLEVLRDGMPATAKPLDGVVEKLDAAGKGCYCTNDEVEAEEDGFLRGAGGEAVHCVGTRKAAAGELGLHLEAVQEPLTWQEAHLCHHAEGHIDDVEPLQTQVLSWLPAAELGLLPLFMLVHGIHEEDQGRRRDEDNVKDPEPVLWDREGHVIAHLFAARLQRVAGKLLLLVLEQITGHRAQNQNPEDEHDQEPETSKHRRVHLQGVKEAAEKTPLSHDCGGLVSLNDLNLLVLLCGKPPSDWKEKLLRVLLSPIYKTSKANLQVKVGSKDSVSES